MAEECGIVPAGRVARPRAPRRRVRRSGHDAGRHPIARRIAARWPRLTAGASKRTALRTPVRNIVALLFLAAALLSAAGCSGVTGAEPGQVTFLMESMPTNLDPRIGTDAQSEWLHSLLFDSLVEHDTQRNIRPDLADRWETPDPQTYIFHLHPGVHFTDGRALTSADVLFTFNSVMQGAVASPLRGDFHMVSQILAPDPQTVIFRLSQPSSNFLDVIARPAMGIIPAGSGAGFGAHPVGSGPFRFVSQQQDDRVIVERNSGYFRTPPQAERITFRIVPDAIVRALELRKGSADLEMDSLTPDVNVTLAKEPSLTLTDDPGTHYAYIAVNFDDPALAHREVRQALAYATDRETLIRYLLRGQARIADGVLPPNNWAYNGDVARYPYDPARAEQLLDSCGFPRRADLGGMRLHLVLKTTTDESTRQLAEVLQNQWRKAGIDLEIRSLETATFLADISRGSFQLYTFRWVGGNNDTSILEFIFDSHRMPPNGANRGHYRNPRVDQLLEQADVEPDRERRRQMYGEVQSIVAQDLPYINLWYSDNTSVHRKRIGNVKLDPAGNLDFLTQITAQ